MKPRTIDSVSVTIRETLLSPDLSPEQRIHLEEALTELRTGQQLEALQRLCRASQSVRVPDSLQLVIQEISCLLIYRASSLVSLSEVVEALGVLHHITNIKAALRERERSLRAMAA